MAYLDVFDTRGIGWENEDLMHCELLCPSPLRIRPLGHHVCRTATCSSIVSLQLEVLGKISTARTSN